MRCRILEKNIERKLWNNSNFVGCSNSVPITVYRGVLTRSGPLSHVTTQGVKQMAQHVQSVLENQPVDFQQPTRFSYKFDIDEKRTPRGFIDQARRHGLCDPFAKVKSEISAINEGCRELLGTDHPILNAAAKYLFDIGDGGKKVRPTMVLLMSGALNETSLKRGGVRVSQKNVARQRRLAEISEMIHTASLFHDDVVDKADMRRGRPSANKVFGNKLAILAGDFILARASVGLARLRSLDTVELLSTVIEHLVRGEILQLKQLKPSLSRESRAAAFELYVRKNYFKTGSLMSNSCRAAGILGGHDENLQGIAYEYGKRIGLAFQLIDDVLDFEGTSQSLGKPALNDLTQGLATAPILLAADVFPKEVSALVGRNFSAPGDVDAALKLVEASNGIQRARNIAYVQAELAIEAVQCLEPSEERDALVSFAAKIVDRTH